MDENNLASSYIRSFRKGKVDATDSFSIIGAHKPVLYLSFGELNRVTTPIQIRRIDLMSALLELGKVRTLGNYQGFQRWVPLRLGDDTRGERRESCVEGYQRDRGCKCDIEGGLEAASRYCAKSLGDLARQERWEFKRHFRENVGKCAEPVDPARGCVRQPSMDMIMASVSNAISIMHVP
jgi:hypothetical protein